MCPAAAASPSAHVYCCSTLIVTEECLLDPSRNPHLGKEGIEKLLKDYLGLDKVIWLWKGMAGRPGQGRAGGGGCWNTVSGSGMSRSLESLIV
jgi:hypothetical protein